MLGWRPLLLSWLKTLPETITQVKKELITENFDRVVNPLLAFLRKSGVKVRLVIVLLHVLLRCKQ